MAESFEPWGKDADLYPATKTTNKRSLTPSLAGFDSLIFFHQNILSQADGPRSHYLPSSSEYMLQAVRKYGLMRGFFLGCDRLLRETEDVWIYPLVRTKGGHTLKYDPVP